MNYCIVGLGSNIDAKKNIARAREFLKQRFDVVAWSRFQTTQPVGPAGQAKFINGSVLIQTPQNQTAVCRALKRIEHTMGRKKSADKYVPRCIDLDVVIWNNRVIDPDFYTRPFLKKAVRQLLPQLKY